MCRMEMFGGMLVLRGVATTNMPTTEALAQMHPAVSHFQALFTALCARCHLFDLIEMCTLLCHVFSDLHFMRSYDGQTSHETHCNTVIL